MAGDTAAAPPWLSIVGIGEDGADGLSKAARALVAEAELVFGGARHLALAGDLVRGTSCPWPSPFSEGIAQVVAARGRRVCVLASGDPFLHGVGATLSRHVPASEMRVLPAPSAFSLAAARLGWPLQETAQVSLHGREIGRIRPFLQPGARILVLTSDGEGPAQVAALLSALGFGGTRLTVLEALGGPRARIREARADAFDLSDVDPLNVLALEVRASPAAAVLPLTCGLPDELFAHDGQLTKREIRAMTLAALAPRHGEVLWDVGAGAGSIAIEWLLTHPSLSALAIEQDETRAARIRANAAALGVPDLSLVIGAAPGAYVGLPRPDVVFIGGGGSEPGVLPGALAALKPGGRLVANAVTLETEAVLLDHYARLGGSLTRIAVSRAVPVKGMTGWRPAMPVTQWSYVKPEGDAA
ncbi:bifunctional cobalt-precorrin-7 (C(5))-methyltransferase/cobalt-precorrin-6B (C(15))-methyltransferase [Azorhizobium doebereinerae]|uniref:bifunctional cobalt-precorrin-7 (C(5))-methyltransferase/cobalt-precorrin-6B (C(15))-methyltransferase n=1 Tax=Azorhizobium doebereinerae TaxID=281091 RepID=UPI000426FB86|nr:bifunctional cobalt-precorrin-7 (C(5))-methyltransferase/cobalt-precorrin-6B (C(15))-methyltransferase [Azorhizobium doebereinerae]